MVIGDRSNSGGTGLQKAKAAEMTGSGISGRGASSNGHARPEVVEGTSLKIVSQVFSFETVGAPDFVDLTAVVSDFVAKSGVTAGQVLVHSKHTTAAIKINENEPLLLKDVAHFLDRAAPKDAYYLHNDFAIRTVNMHEDECPNGHAHCQHLILGTSEVVPVIGGELALGQFQRVFLIELDEPKTRQVVIQVMGL
ncbi:MAG: YjbQ family protein [Dehalococcoidia bacterium]|nr:YjbQ family protein [Dehalococcoidia bacterium]